MDSTCAPSACQSVPSEATDTQTRLALELSSRGCVPHRFVRVPAHYYRYDVATLLLIQVLLLAKILVC